MEKVVSDYLATPSGAVRAADRTLASASAINRAQHPSQHHLLTDRHLAQPAHTKRPAAEKKNIRLFLGLKTLFFQLYPQVKVRAENLPTSSSGSEITSQAPAYGFIRIFRDCECLRRLRTFLFSATFLLWITKFPVCFLHICSRTVFQDDRACRRVQHQGAVSLSSSESGRDSARRQISPHVSRRRHCQHRGMASVPPKPSFHRLNYKGFYDCC